MNKILDRDWNTKVYRERSKLTSHDAKVIFAASVFLIWSKETLTMIVTHYYL